LYAHYQQAFSNAFPSMGIPHGNVVWVEVQRHALQLLWVMGDKKSSGQLTNIHHAAITRQMMQFVHLDAPILRQNAACRYMYLERVSTSQCKATTHHELRTLFVYRA
jgi:hypothetical protein